MTGKKMFCLECGKDGESIKGKEINFGYWKLTLPCGHIVYTNWRKE